MQRDELKKAAGAENDFIPVEMPVVIPEAEKQKEVKSPNTKRTYRSRKRRYAVGIRFIYILVAILLAVIMSLGIAFLSRLAVLNDYNKKLEQIGSDIRRQEQLTATLNIEISEAGKLDRIESEARGRLGMREPTAEEVAILSMS